MTENELALLDCWTRQRNAEAFHDLVMRYSGLVYSTCLRILRNREDAQDAAQECFLKLSQIDDRSINISLGGWLHTVATNHALMLLRGKHRRHERESQYADKMPKQIDPTWDDVMEYIDEAIQDLPENQRSIVVGHFLEHHTHTAIAEDLGITRQTVSSKLKRSVESIRKSLRRKGIAVPAIGFSAMLLSNMSHAAPASLLSSLSKVGLSGITNNHPTALLTAVKAPATFAKTVASMVACVALVVGFSATYLSRTAPSNNTDSVPVAVIPVEDVSAALPAQVEEETESVTVSPDHDELSEEVSLQEGTLLGVLTGTVVDVYERKVSGATVRVFNTDAEGTALTNPDGTYHVEVRTIEKLHEDISIEEYTENLRFMIEASKGDYRQFEKHDAETLSEPQLKLVIARIGAIRGKVVRSDTGEPISSFMMRIVTSKGPGAWDLPGKSFTSEDGSFELPTHVEVSKFQVWAEGYIARTVEIVAPEGEITSDVVITLEQGREVHGIILDAGTGKPVMGTRVGMGRGHFHRWSAYQYPFEVETGADGRFVLTGCPTSGSASLIAYHPDYTPGLLVDFEPEDGEELTIRLDHGSKLAGRLTGGHLELPRPLVLITNTFDEPFSPPITSADLFVYEEIGDLEIDGRFEFPDLPKGRYRVNIKYFTAETPGEYIGPLGDWFPVRAWATVEAGRSTNLPIDIDRWGTVSGTVAFEREPREVSVTLYDRRYPQEPLFCTDEGERDFVLSEDGEFIFGSVPPGSYTIQAVAHGVPEQTLIEHATLNEGSDLQFDLVFK